jgi:ElaB/YqjD/DUF883 family membrane-anchored ribosome-binding protein
MNYSNGETVNQVAKNAKTKVNQASTQAKRAVDEAESHLTDTISSFTENLTERAQRLADQFQDLSKDLRVRAEGYKDKTSETVTRHPFYSIGVAAAVGIALGVLFGGRRK